MITLQDEHGFPLASFERQTDWDNFYSQIPETVKAKYRVVELNVRYPYFYIWTWKKPPADAVGPNWGKDTWRVDYGEAKIVDQFLKTVKRDKEWEKEMDAAGQDTQYFYLGHIRGDCIGYTIEKELGWERIVYLKNYYYTVPKYPDNISVKDHLNDHYHMEWYEIDRFKSMGITRALIQWREEKKFKRLRFRRKRLNRLETLYDPFLMKPKTQRKMLRLQKSVNKLEVK